MRAAWKHIIPYFANNLGDFEMYFTEVTNNIVEIRRKLGFEHLDSENVIECI